MQDISLTKIISIIWFIALITWTLFSVDKGENTMDTGIIVALIGAGSLVGVDILANIRGWRKLSKQIGVDKNERSISTQIGVGDNGMVLSEMLGVKSQSLTEQLGVKSQSLTEQLGVRFQSVTEQLGVDKNSKSLTAQNNDIKEILNKNVYNTLDEINKREIAEDARNEERQKLLDPSQMKLNEVIQSISDFNANWKLQIEEKAKLQKQLSDMFLEFENQKQLIAELNTDINTYKVKQEELLQSIKIKDKEKEELQRQLNEYQNTISNNVSSQEEITKLQKKLDEANEKIDSLEQNKILDQDDELEM